MADQFPEKDRHDQRPDGSGPGHIKSSQKVGAGHNDSLNRMPHPFSITPPNDESGEGKGK